VRLQIAIVLGCATVTFAQPKKPPRPSGAIVAAKLPVADARKLFLAGKAAFVDTRTATEYAGGHIKGAFNIPTADVVARIKVVPSGKTIVLYGAEPETAGADLFRHGIKNVVILQGGLAAWRLAGLPIAIGPR
jgi:rhodanese-related sulfurtransferase